MQRPTLFTVLLAVALPAAAQVPPEIPLRDFFRNPDRAYFRESREQRFGKRLEEVVADRDGSLKALRTALEPVRMTLAAQPS